MEKSHRTLVQALGLGPREHVALVGGGGKTTLLFTLAEELKQAGRHLVTSCTTKLWHREACTAPTVLFTEKDPAWRAKIKEVFKTGGYVFLARDLLQTGKVKGISPSLADELFQDTAIDYLILEADGAAGHPVKAPSEHEPVIPGSATKVIAMLGVEALGRRLEPSMAFRIDLVSKLTGVPPGERLVPPAVVRLFLNHEGLFKGSPDGAHRIVFLNKLDLLKEKGIAKELASVILEKGQGKIERVVMGSVEGGEYEVLRGRSENNGIDL
ncbi:MAG: putative selenium-dependent hydroxylase accessory protein YqeC [Deltaproteobacteria bacterium]|nr:putative selenium-dependent hydroxylase accessory protein YqeC [Deltaproteobacteria bacterium]